MCDHHLYLCIPADKFWKELATTIASLKAPSASATAASDPSGATRELLASARRALEELKEKLLAGYVLLTTATLRKATPLSTPSRSSSSTPRQTPEQTPSKSSTAAAAKAGTSSGATSKGSAPARKKEKVEEVHVRVGAPTRALDLAAGVYTVSVALFCLIRELEESASASGGAAGTVSIAAYQALLAFCARFFEKLREATSAAPGRHALLERLYSTLDENVKAFARLAVKCMYSYCTVLYCTILFSSTGPDRSGSDRISALSLTSAPKCCVV